MFSQTFYPNSPIFLHAYIRHIHGILQLCRWMGDRWVGCVGSLQNLVAPSRATSVNTCSLPIVIIVIIVIIMIVSIIIVSIPVLCLLTSLSSLSSFMLAIIIINIFIMQPVSSVSLSSINFHCYLYRHNFLQQRNIYSRRSSERWYI